MSSSCRDALSRASRLPNDLQALQARAWLLLSAFGEPECGFGVLPKHRLRREGTAGAAAPLVLATEAGCTPQEATE